MIYCALYLVQIGVVCGARNRTFIHSFIFPSFLPVNCSLLIVINMKLLHLNHIDFVCCGAGIIVNNNIIDFIINIFAFICRDHRIK